MSNDEFIPAIAKRITYITGFTNATLAKMAKKLQSETEGTSYFDAYVSIAKSNDVDITDTLKSIHDQQIVEEEKAAFDKMHAEQETKPEIALANVDDTPGSDDTMEIGGSIQFPKSAGGVLQMPTATFIDEILLSASINGNTLTQDGTIIRILVGGKSEVRRSTWESQSNEGETYNPIYYMTEVEDRDGFVYRWTFAKTAKKALADFIRTNGADAWFTYKQSGVSNDLKVTITPWIGPEAKK